MKGQHRDQINAICATLFVMILFVAALLVVFNAPQPMSTKDKVEQCLKVGGVPYYTANEFLTCDQIP